MKNIKKIFRGNQLKSIKRTPYLFVSPYLIFYLAFGLFPVIYSFYISLTNWSGMSERSFIGLENYRYLFFEDYYFLRSIWNTIIFMVGYIPVIMIVGLFLAIGLQSKFLHRKKTMQVMNFMPYITTPVAIGLIFAMLFDWKLGIVNNILVSLNLVEEGINWIGKANNARFVVIVMLIWKFTGYQMVFFASGLANIPMTLYEAAWVDGAKFRHTFFHITLPLLKPILVFLTVTNIIGGFQLVEEPMLLITGFSFSNIVVGGPDRALLTAVWDLYDTAFGTHFNYGRGAAIGYALFIFIFIFSLIGFKITNRKGGLLE